MAFLSDAHLTTRLACARPYRADRRHLNWRLLIALALNITAWVGIISAVASIL